MRFYNMFLLFLCISCNAQKAQRVIDGDTFVMENGEVIRLAEVDCPEITQEFGGEAKSFTEFFIAGKRLKLINKGIDKYGRSICEVYVGDLWLNELLVMKGLAWVYKPYGSKTLYNKQQTAKQLKYGLWKRPHIPPFKFRNNAHYSI